MQYLYDNLQSSMFDFQGYQLIKTKEVGKNASACEKLLVANTISKAFNQMMLTRNDFAYRELRLKEKEKNLMSTLTTFKDVVGIQKNKILFSYIPMKDNRLYYLIEKLNNSLNALVTALTDALSCQEQMRSQVDHGSIIRSPGVWMDPLQPCDEELTKGSAVLFR